MCLYWHCDCDAQGSEYSLFLFDVVYLYTIALNHTLSMGGDPTDGVLMFKHAKDHTFKGM